MFYTSYRTWTRISRFEPCGLKKKEKQIYTYKSAVTAIVFLFCDLNILSLIVEESHLSSSCFNCKVLLSSLPKVRLKIPVAVAFFNLVVFIISEM